MNVRRDNNQATNRTTTRRTRYTAAWIASTLLATAAAFGVAHANEPLRLLMVPAAQSIDTNAQCARGQLFVVRSFSDADLKRGVWIADTLEVRALTRNAGTRALARGSYSATARDAAPDDWQIELAPGQFRLKAHPGNKADEPAIFLGRRANNDEGVCNLDSERLDDGETVTRRLRRLINWNAGKREIEVLVQVAKQ